MKKLTALALVGLAVIGLAAWYSEPDCDSSQECRMLGELPRF